MTKVPYWKDGTRRAYNAKNLLNGGGPATASVSLFLGSGFGATWMETPTRGNLTKCGLKSIMILSCRTRFSIPRSGMGLCYAPECEEKGSFEGNSQMFHPLEYDHFIQLCDAPSVDGNSI